MQSNLLPYPIDTCSELPFSCSTQDEKGVLRNAFTETGFDANNPTRIAQCALAHWNTYIASGRSEYKETFMAQVTWLLDHEIRLVGDTGGWPMHLALNDDLRSQTLLSATTQSNVISVLARAYQLTGETEFLDAAHRAVQTFTMDVLDKGVATPVGENGIFFEDVAMYPAAQTLKGHLSAMLGLYDYAMLTKDCKIEALIDRGLTTLHTLLHAFDSGYWTYNDLLYKRLASRRDHSIHVTLLKVVAKYSDSQYCAEVAMRWHNYQHSLICRSRYLVTSHMNAYYSYLKTRLRRLVFRSANTNKHNSPVRVCTPITAFPIQGGMRGVLAGVTQAMGDQWQMEYLTHYKGRVAEKLKIETFGSKIAHPWQFPGVWFYCLAGGKKLFTQLRCIPGYGLILPQDGTFTSAFAALLGKMAGIRVVCMDHGNVTWVDNPPLQRERMKVLKTYPGYRRFHARLRFSCYWASLRLFAMVATRFSDHFLVAGDEVEEIYRKRYGVHPSRITRYAYMVDVDRFAPCSKEAKASIRLKQGIPTDAIIMIMINRLEVEKGLSFALEGIAQALPALSPDIQARVKVLIVGDGSLRSQVETDIQRLGLASVCVLLGEASPADVTMLLQMSDIFLYSGIHGSNYSMAILEAMATGCAVIASMIPSSNIRLLAEGRGIAIRPANATEIGIAFTCLCNDMKLCYQMGQMAREYVATYHNSLMLKRSLVRASFFVPSLGVDTAENTREAFLKEEYIS